MHQDLQAGANHDTITSHLHSSQFVKTIYPNYGREIFLQFDLDGSQDVPIKRDIQKGV